ncbi:MAG: hypothetical protein JCHSAcid_02350 [uncultured Acidilobus sp. JCHS]|nr:MAG: hypothetical protein JCHSAcid_02350 [uncultured Acidilobus sp. JCHS]
MSQQPGQQAPGPQQASAGQQAQARPAPAAAKPAAPAPPPPVVLPPPPEVDLGAASLAKLLDAIVGLKRSGLLGLLSYIADKADESFLAAATDPALMRLLAVLASLQRGITRVDADDLSRAQNNLEDLTSCAFRALGRMDVSEERKLGLLGAADKLMDPDVQTSLWVILEVAKQLGRCVRESSGKR